MPKGGARNRSGPGADPQSIRSAGRNYTLTALDREGYDGAVPALSDFLPIVTSRHESIWAELWSTPQACAWSMERWRWPVIADLVDVRVRADDPDSAAGLITSIRQLRDDCGLSAAGLKQNGWAISTKAAVDPEASEPEPEHQPSARDRMTVVRDAGAA